VRAFRPSVLYAGDVPETELDDVIPGTHQHDRRPEDVETIETRRAAATEREQAEAGPACRSRLADR
jgi:hypothetical protein